MTNNLFKRAAVFTDIHFGEHADSEVHNHDCLDFVEWFCGKVDEKDCDTIIFGGDWFHNKVRAKNDTNFFSNAALRLLCDTDRPIYFLIGNHDIYFRNTRRIHWLPDLIGHKQITLINHCQVIGNVGFAPWLIGDEYNIPPTMDAQYVFGHFELPTFLVNQMIEMPETHRLSMDHFHKNEMVFSGHFHKRQLKVNEHGSSIQYIGNPFGHNFNDAGDRERGMMVMEWDGEPKFINWDIAPTYDYMQLSTVFDLIENETFTDRFGERATIRVNDDVGVDDDVLIALREELSPLVRSVTIKGQNKKHDVGIETDAEGTVENLDEMFIDHLKQLEDSKLDKDMLVAMFKESGE